MTETLPDWLNLYAEHLLHVRAQYTHALEQSEGHSLLISSGSLKTAFLDDRTYPYMVNPHFKAWLPVTDVPDSFLLIKPGKKPKLLLHQPEDYWHKVAEIPTGYWVEHWDIQPIQSLKDAHNQIGDPGSFIYIGEETKVATEFGIEAINPSSVLNHLHFERASKTPYEIACLEAASLTAARGHLAAQQAFFDGSSENEIAHQFLVASGHREQHTPYSSIVALNEHCAVLHYQFYEHTRFKGTALKSMLIDAGTSYNGYASDITRTYAFKPGIFADLIDAMEQEQLAIIEEVTTGINYAELHGRMHLKIADILKTAGIVDMSPESMVEANVTFNFLPHGLGHLLGLQVHDVAGFQLSHEGGIKPAPDKYPALRLTREITEGQVFTIEPGLYFIPMLLKKLKQSVYHTAVNWPLIEELMPYGGIRIEDNIAVQNGSPVNLTRRAFSAVKAEARSL